MMRLPIKMYLIIIFGVSVILYQYNLSNAWILTDNNGEELNVYVNEKNKNESENSIEKSHKFSHINIDTDADLPPLYIITPTYKRPEQIAELTRLSHTLMLVPNVHWLVIEDAERKAHHVSELLAKSGLPFEHLLAPMPAEYRRKKGPKPRGVSNRNRGLEWIRKNAHSGVFYFADDDNTYDLDIFEEMRYTKKVSMFPVGLITKLGVSSPVVKHGEFVGFYDGWIAGRKFPVDMAGFAVSVKFLLERPKAVMPFKPGFEEDGFLKSLQPFEPKEIELLAANCTKAIFVGYWKRLGDEKDVPLECEKNAPREHYVVDALQDLQRIEDDILISKKSNHPKYYNSSSMPNRKKSQVEHMNWIR